MWVNDSADKQQWEPLQHRIRVIHFCKAETRKCVHVSMPPCIKIEGGCRLPDPNSDLQRQYIFKGRNAMCGRINLRLSSVELTEFFELFREPVWSSPRFNIGPMQRILAIRQNPDGTRLAEPMQWGLVPSWAKDPSIGSKMMNARSDTVATKPAFRTAFRHQRCLIPASGFYEWQKLTTDTKQPWHIFRKDGQPFAFAGLWEHWQSPGEDALESCSIITTEANEFMEEIHDRMPVILSKDDWSMWLDPTYDLPVALTKLLVPCPDGWLEKTAVSTFVNSVKNDSPECIRPVHPERTLF